MKQLYNMKDASFCLGRTVDALMEWCEQELPYFSDGKRMLIGIKDIDDFIDTNKQVFTINVAIYDHFSAGIFLYRLLSSMKNHHRWCNKMPETYSK